MLTKIKERYYIISLIGLSENGVCIIVTYYC